MRFLFAACLSLCLVLPGFNSFAQSADTAWTLQRSVQFALENNISIKQSVLNERLAKLRVKQSQLSQIPSVNTSVGYGRSYGRSVNPVTNQFEDGASYDFLSASGSADVLVFGWFQRRNAIKANKYAHEAANADLDQLRDDISLNVATGFLRAILAEEQIFISEKQVALSAAQLDQTTRFFEAGRLPELNVAQLQAQLSGDSANLIQAITDYNAALLDIKALLNLDFDVPYKPQRPNISIEDQINFAGLTPDDVYATASRNLGSIRGNKLRVSSAQKNLDAAKGALWPQLAVSAQLGTNYATTAQSFNVTGVSVSPVAGTFASDGTNVYEIYQTTPTYTTRTIPLGTQFDNNFRQTVNIGLNIPLFNAWQSQFNVRQSRVNYLTQQLNLDQAELNLKQNVYKAYNDARNSIQKYDAADRAAASAQRAFDLAQRRYELGLTNTVEYLTTQNTLYVAESRLNSAKYDLMFKLKVIDYYLGKELKL